MSKLVSIIVAIYNVEMYLEKCIESIMVQSYKNLEIILINDGSTDNSLEICKRYALKDNRIILINKENGGVSRARNVGLNIAKGDYISFVDGDDYICKDMIKKMVENIEKNNFDMSICGYRIFSDESSKTKISDSSEKNIIMNSDEVLKKIFNSNEINGFLWNKLFRKSIFEKIRLPEDMNVCEDLYIVCKILTNNLNIYYTSMPLYNYRENRLGATKSIDKLLLPDGTIKYVDAFEKIGVLLTEKNDITELIRIRRIKTIMETYYLMIKNKYRNKVAERKIYEELKEEKKYYLSNKYVPIKLKLAFILFIIKLYLEELFF